LLWCPHLHPLQREYDAGQYKRAVKTADTILAKFPHHAGEAAGATEAVARLIVRVAQKPWP
jgi:hypothetical protein